VQFITLINRPQKAPFEEVIAIVYSVYVQAIRI